MKRVWKQGIGKIVGKTVIFNDGCNEYKGIVVGYDRYSKEFIIQCDKFISRFNPSGYVYVANGDFEVLYQNKYDILGL